MNKSFHDKLATAAMVLSGVTVSVLLTVFVMSGKIEKRVIEKLRNEGHGDPTPVRTPTTGNQTPDWTDAWEKGRR